MLTTIFFLMFFSRFLTCAALGTSGTEVGGGPGGQGRPGGGGTGAGRRARAVTPGPAGVSSPPQPQRAGDGPLQMSPVEQVTGHAREWWRLSPVGLPSPAQPRVSGHLKAHPSQQTAHSVWTVARPPRQGPALGVGSHLHGHVRGTPRAPGAQSPRPCLAEPVAGPALC